MIVRSIVKDFANSTLGSVSSVFSTIVVFIVAAHALGPALFGQFAFAYAINSVLGLLLDYGYPVSFLRDTREVEATRRVELRRSALWLKVILFLVLTPVALAVPVALGIDFFLAIGLWIGISMTSFANFFSTMLRAINLHGSDARHNVLASLAGLTAAIAVFHTYRTLQAFSLVFIITGAVYLALTLNLWMRYCQLSPGRVGRSEIATEARRNFAYVLDAMGRRSFGFIDVAILGLFASFEVVGLYQAGQKVTQGVSIFAQPFNNVLLPKLARSVREADEFQRKARQAFLVQLLFGFAAGSVVVILGPLFITLLFSDAFAESIELLVYFGVLIAARYSTSAVIISRTAQGFIRERLFSNLFAVFLLLIAGPILTYFFGAEGLLVTLITSSLLGALLLASLTKGRQVAT